MTQIKMADAEYFALDRLSFSSVKYLLDSPAKYLYKKQKPFLGNEFTELGTAIHMYLQDSKDMIAYEPDLSGIKTKEGVIAKNPGMTNEGKALIKEFRAALPKGIVAVPYETKDLLHTMENNFKTNAEIAQLMSKVTSVEGAYLCDIGTLKFKGKVDFEGENFIVDLKSTGKSADIRNFRYTIKDSHYDLQAAIYLTMKAEAQKVAVETLDYYIIAVETFAPYEVVPYQLSKETLEVGFQKLIEVQELYNTFIKEKKLYRPGIRTI